MSETTVTFDNGRVYKREGERYVWRTSPDNIGDIIAERDMVWAFDKIAVAQADLAAARREVETVTREREEARAALEDVRRVEAWLRDWVGEDRRTIRYAVGEFEALDYDGEYMAGEQSLEALGRALAQEAGE